MRKPPNSDYVYIDSEAIKQRIAFHKKSGWLFCEDKYPNGKLVSYSPKELEILEKSGEPISIEVHLVKTVFTGELVKYEQNGTGNNNSGKSNEGTKPENFSNNSTPVGNIQKPSGGSKEEESGYFDIY